MNETVKQISVVKFALGALALVFVLNFVLRILLKLEGVPVTIGVAIGVAGLVAAWFGKTARRVPTPQERLRFLWLYGGILALTFLGLVLLVSLRRAPSVPSLLIIFLHYLPYPAFAQMFLSEKHFGRFIKKGT